MAITGSIKELNIVDILQMLALSQKSGKFKIIGTADHDTANLYISSGRVVLGYFSSKDVKMKLLGKADNIAMDRSKYETMSVGNFLREMVEKHIFSAGYMRDVLTKEIQSLIYRIFKWDEGTFAFDESDVKTDLPLDLLPSIRIENVIMEGSRQIDEWSVINSKINSLSDTVLLDMSAEDINKIDFTPREWMIISYINGERSVQKIIDMVGDEFETAKTIYGLLVAGICKLIPKTEKVILNKEAIINLIKNGEYDNAIKAIKERREGLKRPNEFLLMEAEIFWKTEQYNLAIKNYETYLEDVGEFPSIVYDLALCYIYAGNIEKASNLITNINMDDISFELIDKVEKLKNSIDTIWDMKRNRIPIYKRIEYDGSE